MLEPSLPGYIVLFLAVMAVVLVICWIVLPFAIIGTKPLLRQLLAETRRTNELLEQHQTPPAQAAAGPAVARKRVGDW